MGRKWSLPRLVLGALIGAVVLTIFVTAGTSTASLGAFNTNWDGTSGIRTTAEKADTSVTIARNVSTYATVPPNQSVAFVLSPDESYGAETARLRSYVRSGGTLLVAEDYRSNGNEILAAVGATARVDGRPLRDEQRAGPSPAFPKASANNSHPTTADVNTLVLNHGSVVEPGNATVLANSSSFSYLDTNGNEALDDSETLTSRPVVTTERVGQGTVIVVSDPSLFLNSMLERGDNRRFLRAVIGEKEHVLLDVSHSVSVPPLVALQLSLQDSPVGIVLVGMLSVTAVLVVASSPEKPLWIRDRGGTPADSTLSQDDVLATLRNRHPDWDEERIQRVTDSLIQTDTNDRTDD